MCVRERDRLNLEQGVFFSFFLFFYYKGKMDCGICEFKERAIFMYKRGAIEELGDVRQSERD